VSTWCSFQKVINLLLHFHILVVDSLLAITGFDVQEIWLNMLLNHKYKNMAYIFSLALKDTIPIVHTTTLARA
jgi:hypothetical protein